MVKQNPATDPVSAAMSAIESALNLTDDDEAAAVRGRQCLHAAARSSEADGRDAGSQADPTRRRRADAPSRGPASAVRAGERTEAGDPRGDARK